MFTGAYIPLQDRVEESFLKVDTWEGEKQSRGKGGHSKKREKQEQRGRSYWHVRESAVR